jgi:hypothetical protein
MSWLALGKVPAAAFWAFVNQRLVVSAFGYSVGYTAGVTFGFEKLFTGADLSLHAVCHGLFSFI